jgi:putative membrane protein
MDIQQEQLLNSATFNPKVKIYIFIVVLGTLIFSVIGLLLVPFWLLGVGQWLSKKYFHTLKCHLTNKNLQFSKGFIVHIEKTIPLENIQDLSFIGGPVLRYFGLTLIKVETAGGGGGQHNNNMMSMLGINHAEQFKTEILNQREIVINSKYNNNATRNDSANDVQLLQDIKQELVAIKDILSKQ